MPDNYAIDVPKNEAILVSVIIPNYNHGPFLNQRINSILNQTYQNIELIIMDDVPTDGSREVIEQYRNHPKVNAIIYNEQNSGSTFRQWDKGMQLVNGEWVWIAESDDWCEPTLLQNLVEGIQPTTCISFCMSVAVQDNEILYTNKSKYLAYHYPGYEYVREFMLYTTTISNASQAIFRKEVYHKIDKSFTTYKFSGDWLFWMLVAQHGEVFVSGKCLNYFRKHPKDVTSPSLKNGMAYREYLHTADTLEQERVVTGEEKTELLLFKYNQLLWDHRVEKDYVEEISKLYHAKLGSKLHGLGAYRTMGKRSYFKAVTHKLFGR